jgi:putative phosphoesterase
MHSCSWGVQAHRQDDRHRFSTTKTIGLISDTHIPVRAKILPGKVLETFDKTEFILHAGDLVTLAVIDELEQIAPVLAVSGNMDGPEVRGKLPRVNSIRVLNWRIGVMHDPGTVFGAKRMREIAKQNGFDVLVYGHTHSASVRWEGKTLFVNPGSPTNPARPFITKPSIGLLSITKENILPEIVHI